MPLPLVWLGAAALSALVVKGLSDDRKSQQKNENILISHKLYEES